MRRLDLQFFGGRGASSGMSAKGKPYGSEYRTVLAAGNIKFIKNNAAQNAKDPLETMAKGRIYATVNDQDEVHSINFYDDRRKRYKSINLIDHEGKGVHVHSGYYHNEYGEVRPPNDEEQKLIDKVTKLWKNKKGK